MSPKVVLVISDLHAGSSLAVCPPEFPTYEGSGYVANKVQGWIWDRWMQFNQEWQEVIGDDDYLLVHNGDAIEGLHHGSKQVIAASTSVHNRLAVRLLEPFAAQAVATYIVKGTPAHVGLESESELGRALGARPTPDSREFAAYHWLIRVHGTLCSFRHHIGTTTRQALSANALGAALSEEQQAAACWGHEVPRVVCRGHRHVFGEYNSRTGLCVVGPSWQVKTEFAHKVVPSAMPTVGSYALDFRGLPPRSLPRVVPFVYAPEPVTPEEPEQWTYTNSSKPSVKSSKKQWSATRATRVKRLPRRSTRASARRKGGSSR